MDYIVAKITTPDGVFFTARSDDRKEKQVVQDGINGYRAGNRGRIYQSLYNHEVCLVENQAAGMSKEAAESLKKAFIKVASSQGYEVLNFGKKEVDKQAA